MLISKKGSKSAAYKRLKRKSAPLIKRSVNSESNSPTAFINGMYGTSIKSRQSASGTTLRTVREIYTIIYSVIKSGMRAMSTQANKKMFKKAAIES